MAVNKEPDDYKGPSTQDAIVGATAMAVNSAGIIVAIATGSLTLFVAPIVGLLGYVWYQSEKDKE